MPPKSRNKRARVETPVDNVDEEYDSREYWEKRYHSSEGYHNWYYSFDELRPFFSRILGENFLLLEGASVGSVLEIGCGDSPLIHHFLPPKCAQTAPHLFGIDFSPTIVRHLQATLQKGPLCFSEMDAGRTTFVSGKFALVIDKGARVRRKPRRHK